ncbi:hypothetical protein BDZ89DRAFT_885487, partial [Hymenopellis radicata]
AGAAIFDQTTTTRQRHFRVPGGQTDNRAKLFSILVALTLAPSRLPLTIVSTSEYALRSIVSWGPKNASAGWKCDHGDILHQIQRALQHRPAAVHFIFLKSNSVNDDATLL